MHIFVVSVQKKYMHFKKLMESGKAVGLYIRGYTGGGCLKRSCRVRGCLRNWEVYSNVRISKKKGDVERKRANWSHNDALEKRWETILKSEVDICEQQYGYTPRERTTDQIFTLKILLDKCTTQKELNCVFVNLVGPWCKG